jgi:hypothetical protein
METNVTTLLREFPKVRSAALRGETVIIRSREGDFQFSLLRDSGRLLIGCLQGQLESSEDSLDRPTSEPVDWKPSL